MVAVGWLAVLVGLGVVTVIVALAVDLLTRQSDHAED
jgi:hypothetical protein